MTRRSAQLAMPKKSRAVPAMSSMTRIRPDGCSYCGRYFRCRLYIDVLNLGAKRLVQSLRGVKP